MSDELRSLAAALRLPELPGPTAARLGPALPRRAAAAGSCSSPTTSPSPEQLAALCAALRAERDDVLLAIDEEGGDVTRLEWDTGSSYPGGAALGVVDDVGADRGRSPASIAAELAARRRQLEPRAGRRRERTRTNPVIGARVVRLRSGARRPPRRARSCAARRAARRRRVREALPRPRLDGRSDSHLELPVARRATLEAGLEPFRAAIAAGVAVDHDGAHLVPRSTTCPRRSSRAHRHGPAARRARLRRAS